MHIWASIVDIFVYLKWIQVQCNVLFLSVLGIELGLKNDRKIVYNVGECIFKHQELWVHLSRPKTPGCIFGHFTCTKLAVSFLTNSCPSLFHSWIHYWLLELVLCHVTYPIRHVMLPTSSRGRNDWQTDTCQNITDPQLPLRAVENFSQMPLQYSNQKLLILLHLTKYFTIPIWVLYSLYRRNLTKHK